MAVVMLGGAFRDGILAIHRPVLEAIGAVIFASGPALAIWPGRN